MRWNGLETAELQVDKVDGILELTSGLLKKKRDQLRSRERGADIAGRPTDPGCVALAFLSCWSSWS